jgi:ferredoxin-thioredoxin reductase catalytic subunit
MIVCPGCKSIAEAGTWPSRMASDADTPVAVDWWCPTCLALNIAMEHAGDCHCAGCAPQ